MLRLEGVRVRIRGFAILRGVSLEIPAGALVGLVGRNGAGKTTTLKSIMGIIPVASGSIHLEGVDLVRLPGHWRARLGIGYVPEDRRLIGALTVQDNILMPAWASGQADARRRLDAIYQLMPDVQGLAGRRAAQCSGGQQKMVALARAVMTGAKLLLLDEPFEGLSPAMGEKLAGTIRALQREGLAVLVAESDTKRLGFAERLYTLERGEILPPAAG